ncbi:MAG: hybrid sensor histidine kinase/response regulator [Salinarimonas sp.]
MSAPGPRLLADVFGALRIGPGWRAGLPEALRLLGEGLAVDRVFLFRVHEVAGGLGQTCLADWASPGLAPLADDPRNVDERIPEDDPIFRDWAARRRRGLLIQGHTRDLTGYLAQDFAHQRIVSFVSAPVMVGGVWWGHLGLDDCTRERAWTDDERAVLETVVAHLGAILEAQTSGHAAVAATRTALLESAPDGIIVIDEDGCALEFNPAAEAMFGLPREEAIGAPIADTITPEHLRAAHHGGISRYLSGGAPRILGTRVSTDARRATGEIFPVELMVTEISVDRRRMFAGFVRDLTAIRAAERELARQREALYRSEKMSALGSLLAGVAHELNNPLSVVVARAAMLAEDVTDPAITDQLRRLREQAERCARISRSFLAIARQGPTGTAPQRFEDAVASAVDATSYALGSSGIALETRFRATRPALVDGDQLVQILVNLLVNAEHALRAVDGERRIVVETLDRGMDVVCEVRDNGPGVGAEIRSRVFDPFFTTKPVGIGTGVGLSVSQGIAQAHGGALDLLPDGPGAQFRLTLSAAEAGVAAAAQGGGAPAQAGPRRHTGRRVLVVDDEPEVGEVIADILRRDGHAVALAADGAEALERLATEPIDAILCDLRVPMMDGPALLARLRASRPDLAARLAFVTGDLLSAAPDAPDVPLIAKPFDPPALRAAVRALLAGGGAPHAARASSAAAIITPDRSL